MLGVSESTGSGGAIGKRGRDLRCSDKNVIRTRFPEFARLAYPIKTAAVLADIGGRDERTAKRWLACECEPPIAVSLAIYMEMHKRI